MSRQISLFVWWKSYSFSHGLFRDPLKLGWQEFRECFGECQELNLERWVSITSLRAVVRELDFILWIMGILEVFKNDIFRFMNQKIKKSDIKHPCKWLLFPMLVPLLWGALSHILIWMVTWPSVLRFVIILVLCYHRCWLLKNRFHFLSPFFYYIAIMICARIKMFWSWETTHRFSFLRPFYSVTVGMCLASKIKWFIICVSKCDLLVCQIQWGLFGRGRVLEFSIIGGRF